VIRVLICDDQALVRAGLCMMLEAQPHLEVVGEAGDGRQAIDLASRLELDVVLMDIRMPGVDGIEATRQILARAPDGLRVLVLTTFDEDEYVYAALRAGASGFMLKSAPPADLIRAVQLIHDGRSLLAPEVTRHLIEDYLRRSFPAITGFPELTDRETEIMRQIARGLSNAEIADELFISEATVKSHINRVFAKLHLRDRVHAVILAYERGLVAPND
jgi:DNA-binding NarL/FixJ family response regulator